MVRKDFNHPSVILYCIGNEIHEYGSGFGGALARDIAERIRFGDDTRFITTAVSSFWAVAGDVIGDLKIRLRRTPRSRHALRPADLTMRRLAAALEVQPSALYWHFPNKQTLLAELSDRIVAEVHSGPADLEWTSRVRAEASALRRALLAHRDGAELVASTFALGLGSRTAHDRLAAAIATGGFDDESVQRSTAALLHFVLGHVLHEQQRQQHRELGVHGDAPPAAGQDDAPEAGFAFGVDLLVGGLQFRRAGV